jgi:hypothetical protein
MAHTELELAQVDLRVQAFERCVQRQREVLRQHMDSGDATDAAMRALVDFETRLADLRRSRRRIRDAIAAANAQQLLDMFGMLPPPRSDSGSYLRRSSR